MFFILVLLIAPHVQKFAVASDDAPVNFPPDIEIKKVPYENWSYEIKTLSVWTSYPKSDDQVLQISSWAVANNFTLRPGGNRYSWSPLTVLPDYTDNVVIINSRPYLTKLQLTPELNSNGSASVELEPGVTMDELLKYLEDRGYTVASYPVIGDVTVMGVVATGSHGSGLPKNASIGLNYGSLSNSIVNLTAIIWNESSAAFELKKFERSDPNIDCLLANLGQIFITKIVLRVGANSKLRCVSRTDIHIDQLYAPPLEGSSEFTENSLAALANQSNTVGAIFFPFTKHPWVKIWTDRQEKPFGSREVTKPYNYPFTENIPSSLGKLLKDMQSGNSVFTPFFTNSFANFIATSLKLFRSDDIWGWTKNVNLNTKNSTLPVSVNGQVVLTSRGNLQKVIYDVFQIYTKKIKEFADRKEYPMNAPLEIRISAMDDPNTVLVKDATSPSFAPSTKFQNQPDFDVCVWVDMTTFATTKLVYKFMQEVETEFIGRFDGSDALLRQEWSKRWGYSDQGPWSNKNILAGISKRYSGWESAVQNLKSMDPRGIYQNQFLKNIMG